MQKVWLMLTISILPLSLGLQINFENADQISGFDVMGHTLRVRKYNRTTIVLNGTTTLKTILNNSYVLSTDMFHSPLGNQQFNHYPMKLPSQRVCDFLNTLHDEYSKHLTDIYNLPAHGTCPIYPQEVYTINKVFPADAVPAFVPTGLWKAFIIFSLEEEEVARFVWIVKVSNDYI
ncbi:uncharacterized protein LOC128715296 [Anopheles marshallii]|uniref:uncharacterized protein LOC128715296 n=1 Tax=Anopheles marshallii TaxID=1521116 RepID=UPI00237B9226|nr:uncharacterized protein LOC128715296 [Anopheles marshallii]